jgi:hypothetical protein
MINTVTKLTDLSRPASMYVKQESDKHRDLRWVVRHSRGLAFQKENEVGSTNCRQILISPLQS